MALLLLRDGVCISFYISSHPGYFQWSGEWEEMILLGIWMLMSTDSKLVP